MPPGDFLEALLANELLTKSEGNAMKENRSKLGACRITVNQLHDPLVVAVAVRMARAALGWSQLEFGRLLGMTQRSVHRIEQGHSEPRRTTLLAIESLLRKAGIDIERRLDGGLCIVVPVSVLEHRVPVDVAAPALSDCASMSERKEEAEVSPCNDATLDPSIRGTDPDLTPSGQLLHQRAR